MKKDDSIYLRHILDAISRIEEYTQGISYEDFMDNHIIQMEFCYAQILLHMLQIHPNRCVKLPLCSRILYKIIGGDKNGAKSIT